MNRIAKNQHPTGFALAAVSAAMLLAACADKPGQTESTAAGTGSTSTPVAVPASTPIGGEGVGSGSVPEASVTTSAVPEILPTEAEAKTAWQEGVAAFDARDYETASVRLQIAADGRPDDAYVRYLQGLSLWKSGHPAEAEEALVRSATINGGSIKTWINLARVRMERKDAAGALEAADEALALDPGSADGLHQRGRALAGTGRNDEAIGTLEQARTAAPDNGYIANTLGHLLLTMGRIDEAIPHLEAARDRLPGVAFVRNNLGVAYERHGDLDRAAEEYRAAVDAGDSNGKAAASLARITPLVGPRIAGEPQPPQESTGSEDSSS